MDSAEGRRYVGNFLVRLECEEPLKFRVIRCDRRNTRNEPHLPPGSRRLWAFSFDNSLGKKTSF